MSETASSYSSLLSDIQALDGTLTTPGNYTITLGANITAGGDLEAISLASGVNLTINGAGFTYSGGGDYEGLFVYQGDVTVENLTIADAVAQGGAGGSGGGGGGAGLGGGLFVAGTTDGAGSIGGNVTLSGVTFTDDSAIGGAGGAGKAGGAGGGGGLGGAGGSGNAAEPGGGGGIGASATGSSNASAGGTGIIPGTGGGGASGVGGGIAASGDQGGYGGGGGGSDSTTSSAIGGFGGGGGADPSFHTGGHGGFGGGGGAGAGTGGSPGTGGGSGGAGAGASGGGGLGAGGDIFVQAGGHLTIESGALNAGTVTGGDGAFNGDALGNALFLEGGQVITLSPALATTLTIAGGIDGNQGFGVGLNATPTNAGLVINGEGAVLLAGSAGAGAGTFATTIDSGTLILGTEGAAGTGDISFNGTGTLAFSATAVPSNTLDGFTFGDVIDITNFASTGDINANGSGVLSLDNGAIMLNFGAAGANDAFALSADGAGGTDIALIPPPEFNLLNDEISAADSASSGSFAITLTADALATGVLDTISLAAGVTLSIDGGGHTLNGEGAYAGLVIDQGSVTVQNLTIANDVAQGAGGGVSIGTGGTVAAAVTLSNVSFADDTATGSTAYGGDIYVAAGQNITIDGGTLGLGTVTGGQDLGRDLYLAAGASATLAAPSGTTLAVAGSIFEAGSATVVLNGPGTVEFVTANTLTSPVQLDGGTLLLGAAGAAAVSFAAGTSATLQTAGTIGDHGQISGFGFGDEIDITGLSLSGSTFESLNGSDQLVVVDSSLAVTLTFAPSLSNEVFAIKSDGHGGAEIVLSTLAASSFAQLNTAIEDIDAATKAGDYTINLTGGITNLDDLTAISLHAGVSLTIDGLGHTLSGGGQYEGLFVYQGDVTVQNLTIANAVAQGGAGGYGGGGGGAGLGGGLFIAGSGTATTGGDVTLSAVNFISDSAIGGAGGAAGAQANMSSIGDGGGGGGLGGAGGSHNGLQGGGGGVGNLAAGGSDAAGAAGIIPGAGGGSAFGGEAGGASAGGGGGGVAAGGGGVGGGSGSHASHGGTGGFGGGGGGSSEGGGGGGFGGGGGGADGGGNAGAAGGAGGFGGGGGGGESQEVFRPSGAGGFGAGAGSDGAGGGGLGAGGDIFVQAGASLTIESGTLGLGTVAGGTGGVAGDAFGTAIFLQGNVAETLSPAAGTTLTIAGSIADQTGSLPTASSHGAGGIVINGAGTVRLTAASDYTGGTTIDSGTLILGTAGAAGAGDIVFGSGDPPVLAFTIADAPTNTIASFGPDDTIDITNLLASQITGRSFNTNTDVLSITYTGESAPLNLTFANNLHPGFIFSSDGASGTDIVPCFAAGTRILGLHGDILVEDAVVGDELVTVRDGESAPQKVVWTGRRAIDIRRHPCPELVRPVRIIAGAIAPGVPERDLRLSPEHAVYLDGKLFTAISLVNGTTIYQEQNTTHVTYHHIELASHDILMAEGLPCESYLDTGSKTMFDNVSGITILHPDFGPGPGADFCAPLVREGDELEAIRARLKGRATRAA